MEKGTWLPGRPGAGPASDEFSQKQLQVFARQVLCGQVFVGEYRERSYVTQLRCYRDVVELSAKEMNLREALGTVQEWILKNCGPGHPWTRISTTGPSGEPCFHVTLKNVPFGRYWFLLKNIKFTETEAAVHLKCLRPFAEAGATAGAESGEEQEVKWGVLLEDWKQALSRGLGSALAVKNVQQAVMFLLVMLTSLLVGTLHAVRHLGDFTIRLLHEASGLVRALTPLALGIVDFFSKCVGGLYILVAMMFGKRGPVPPGFGGARQVARYNPAYRDYR